MGNRMIKINDLLVSKDNNFKEILLVTQIRTSEVFKGELGYDCLQIYPVINVYSSTRWYSKKYTRTSIFNERWIVINETR